jgi:hypothetical protein
LGTISQIMQGRYLKYALLAQFYVALALEYYCLLPASYPLLAASGLLFVGGLLLLVRRGLALLLGQDKILTYAVVASDSVFPQLANRVGTYFDPNFPPQWIIMDKADNNLGYQEPLVDHYLSSVHYTILENDSMLLVARTDA